MTGVLDGVRVLDFGRFIAGPFCATLLGDLGADVIRVERVDGGEDRWLTPVTDDQQGALFLQVGRNKRSLTLDPVKPDGAEIVRKLVATADVVVANLPPETRRQIGLDYESLAAIKPDIIVSTVTCFASGGPWSDKVGFDGLAQAMSGAMYMSGPEGLPTRSSAPFVDFCTGSLLAFSTMAALRHRDLTGEGQELEGALLKTALTMMGSTLIEQDQLGIDRVSTHNRGQTAAPSDTFATSDGAIICSVIGQGQFTRWAKLVGREDLVSEPRFADDLLRGDNAVELCDVMAAWCAERSTAEVMEALEDLKIPGAPVYSPQQALDDAHIDAIGFLERVDFPTAASAVPIPGFPVAMSQSPGRIRHRAPMLGEHTDEVLTELGYGTAEIAALRDARVV
jgi:crotonobetainyl-CoA:carnitine CoA-transferase CaiB-like acyl-CoA transferase